MADRSPLLGFLSLEFYATESYFFLSFPGTRPGSCPGLLPRERVLLYFHVKTRGIKASTFRLPVYLSAILRVETSQNNASPRGANCSALSGSEWPTEALSRNF